MSVQAKYRCMRVSRTWQGHWEIELSPVMQSDKHPENKVWWEATPSGEMTLIYGKDADVSFEWGAYYMILLERPDEFEEGEPQWSLYRVSRQYSALEIELSPKWDNDPKGLMHGKFEASIQNEGAWPPFEGHVNSKWQVTVSYACSREDGEEY